MFYKLDNKTCIEYTHEMSMVSLTNKWQKKHVEYERLEFINHSSVKSKSKTCAKFEFEIHLETPSLCAKFKLKQITNTLTHV